jgi:hypothetical protein
LHRHFELDGALDRRGNLLGTLRPQHRYRLNWDVEVVWFDPVELVKEGS